MLDALIEQRPALDRGDTQHRPGRQHGADDPRSAGNFGLAHVPVGDPPHVYRIKAVEGLLKDEETGVRFASEITVIR